MKISEVRFLTVVDATWYGGKQKVDNFTTQPLVTRIHTSCPSIQRTNERTNERITRRDVSTPGAAASQQ